jgi:hypothetical protein
MKSKEVLIDMFFSLFRINTPEWYHAFLGGKQLSSKSVVVTLRGPAI